KDIDGCARDRTVGRHAAWRTRHEAAQPDTLLRHDRDARGLAAGNEFVDLAEGARVKRHLAMVERAEHEIGGALQLRPLRGDTGRHAGLAYESTVGLRVFVHAVAAQCEEGHARG